MKLGALRDSICVASSKRLARGCAALGGGADNDLFSAVSFYFLAF